jgi:hypothetical protein
MPRPHINVARGERSRCSGGLPLEDVLTMDQRLAQSVSSARLYTLLPSMLGLCGLILTAAGIYGVVAYCYFRAGICEDFNRQARAFRMPSRHSSNSSSVASDNSICVRFT